MSQESYLTHLNAGNALVAQAQQMATQDFKAARALWQEAGKQFFLAHKADDDEPEAAFKLAQAWMAEAHALQKEGSPNAQVMWENAAAQSETAFDLKPDNPRVAMAVASCHHWAGDSESAQAWADIAQKLKQLDSAKDDAED